jgi:hypothetical protein
MLNGFKKESGLIVATETSKCRNRSDEVSKKLSPNGHNTVVGGECVKFIARRRNVQDQSPSPNAVKKHE